MKSDNKGFSLIELLVAMAIASIVGVAVFGFMVVGAKSFQKTSADVNVQHEAQLVLNQIQDMLVDTNVGVEYTEETQDHVLTMYNFDLNDSSRHVYEVVYREADKKLYYNEYMPAASEEGGARTVGKGAVLYREQLLGENISSFSADLSALEKKRVVRVDLEIKKTASSYATSSNITLRNAVKIGNSIPKYMDDNPKKDPVNITGIDQFYFEPGREVDLKTLGAYRVKMEDGSDSVDQDIRFFISDRATPVSGTSVSTGGILNISKAQKQDFYVLVTSRSGKGAPLEIKINMIIVDSVDITLTSYTKKSDGSTVNNVVDYVFEAGDRFTLQADVKGRNLDKADVPMYGITWALGTGSEAYATIGDVKATAKGSTCMVTMKNDMKVQNKSGQDPFTITATSVRSTQIPYYSGTKKTPVVGTFQAFAHQAAADFQIAGKAKLLRGKHDNSMNVYVVSDIVNAIPGFDRSKHTVIAKVTVNELLYQQEENAVSTTYTVRRDITDSSSRFQAEGVALGVYTPDIDKSNPNVTYEYETTFYIFDKHEGDNTTWETLRVMGPGETSKDGYNLADAKYQSNTIIQQSERLFLFYNRKTYDKNEDGSINWSSWTGDYTAKVTPRVTNDYLNGEGWINDNLDTWVPVYDCPNVEDNGIKNKLNQWDSFRIYYQKDGSWVEFDDSRRILKDGDNYPNLANCLEAKYENNSLKVTYYPKRWSNDVPQMVRVVPCLKYTASDGQQRDGVLFDSYAEVYLWNIEVQNVESYQTGIKHNALSSTTYSRLYFPSPLDQMFEDLGKGEYKVWKYPYPMNVSGHENDIQNITLSYKLSYNADGYGNKTWYLHLKHWDNKNAKYENLGVYTCKDTEQNWTMIENSKVPDNLVFDY